MLLEQKAKLYCVLQTQALRPSLIHSLFYTVTYRHGKEFAGKPFTAGRSILLDEFSRGTVQDKYMKHEQQEICCCWNIKADLPQKWSKDI